MPSREKNGNSLVFCHTRGGVPPNQTPKRFPAFSLEKNGNCTKLRFGKKKNYFRFFLVKASLREALKKITGNSLFFYQKKDGQISCLKASLEPCETLIVSQS